MPSGAKKRKAARKRKEKENKTNPSTNNPQGTLFTSNPCASCN